MVAGWPKSFWSAARKESEDYKIKDEVKLKEIAGDFGVAKTVMVEGEEKDRDIYDIAVEVGEKILGEWGKQEGEIYYAKRAPKARYDLWKKLDVIPRGIDREIVEIMHRTHMGVDQDYQEPDETGVAGRPGRRLGRLHDGHRYAGRPLRDPLSGSWGDQPGGPEKRSCQYHHPWPRTRCFPK